MISVEEALQQILSVCPREVRTEIVPVQEALNRSLGEDIFSDRDYPPFFRSAMDGYALPSESYQKNKIYTIAGTLYAGDSWEKGLISSDSCIKIMTGAPVPEFLDLLIRVEDSLQEGENKVSFQLEGISEYMNIAKKGEDIKSGELILKKGDFLGIEALSVLATLGKTDVAVFQRPSVQVYSTGNEVIPITATPGASQIRDTNSFFIRQILNKYNIEVSKYSILPDNPKILRETLEAELDKDILIFSGGVSAGDLDLLPGILKEMGIDILFHKIKIKPGKPILVAKAKNSCTIFALPGNPYSVQVCTKIFVEPYIRKFMRLPEKKPLFLPLAETKRKRHGFRDYFPVRMQNLENKTYLETVSFNGSGDIRASLFSQGLAFLDEKVNEAQKGESLPFYFW
ncbi:MAG: molybdopterin molybdotransferase MoeA [Leptospiraceae bacterium]|nr:molybdopterin molybdotransferase MoeA [Leptospiraceae bacterium]